MSEQGRQYLINEMRKVIFYCVDEYDVSLVEAIGCLHAVVHSLTEKMFADETEEKAEDDVTEDDNEKS